MHCNGCRLGQTREQQKKGPVNFTMKEKTQFARLDQVYTLPGTLLMMSPLPRLTYTYICGRLL